MPTDLEQAASEAATLAVRRDPTAAAALDKIHRALTQEIPDGQRIAFLVAWGYLALDDPDNARELFRGAAAYGNDPALTGPAAVLSGLISFRVDQPSDGMAAWHLAGDKATAILDEIDFSGELGAQLTDELIPTELDAGEPTLPRLLTGLDAGGRSMAALALSSVHLFLRPASAEHLAAAERAARQVVAIGQPEYVGAAWVLLADVLAITGDETAAAEAYRQAIASGGRFPAAELLRINRDPVTDVPTMAKTGLGKLQRDAGELDAALETLTDAARDDDRSASFALAETHQLAGNADAARALYLKLADCPGSTQEDSIFNLGLLAKQERDLPEATRWFERYIDAGYSAGALAAAHLGELAYWLGEKATSLRWYEYTLAHTAVPELIEEAKSRTAEMLAEA